MRNQPSMRAQLALTLISLLGSSCVTVDGGDDDGPSGRDAAIPADSGSADSGNTDSGVTDMDTGVADMDTGVADMDTGVAQPIECDPDFGAADACGGALTGVWTYRVACGRTPIGAALEDQCPAVELRAETFEAGSGTLTVAANNFDLDVNVEVHVEAALPAQCTINGCPGTQALLSQAYPQATVACVAAGAGCDCTIDGPVGTFTNGTVVTSGGVATVDGTDTYYYCVQGSSLIYRRFGTGVEEAVYVLDR
jgi:hypothetical protein